MNFPVPPALPGVPQMGLPGMAAMPPQPLPPFMGPPFGLDGYVAAAVAQQLALQQQQQLERQRHKKEQEDFRLEILAAVAKTAQAPARSVVFPSFLPPF